MFWIPVQADVPLRFAVLNFSGDADKKWRKFSEYLSDSIGVPVKLITTKFVPLLKRANKFDLILTNPVSTVIINKENGHEILSTMNHKLTGPKFAGMIIVHKASGITSLQELAGKKVGAVDLRSAAGGYLFQARELVNAGLDLKKDFKKFTVIPSQKAIIHGVIKKRLDAGFIRVGMLQEYKDTIDISQIEILNKQPYEDGPLMRSTEMYTHWGLLASKNMSPPLKAKIRAAALALKPTDAAAIAADINGFVGPSDNSDIEALMKDMGHPVFN